MKKKIEWFITLEMNEEYVNLNGSFRAHKRRITAFFFISRRIFGNIFMENKILSLVEVSK